MVICGAGMGFLLAYELFCDILTKKLQEDAAVMKKIQKIAALSLALLVLAGCASGKPASTQGSTALPEASTTETTTQQNTQGTIPTDTQPTTESGTEPSTQPSTQPPQTAAPETYPTAPMEPTDPEPEANPYKVEDFVYENGFLTCTAADTMVGIDVSVHQGIIDWQQVAAAGVDFVMIRAAYRGYKYGQVNADSNALANIQGAREAGLLVGVYIYSQAVSVVEAVEEAEFLLQMLEGIQLDLPITFDWERYSSDSRTANVSGRTVTDCAIAFCETIRAGEREAMIYFNPTQALEELSLPELTEYPFWLAQYDTTIMFPYRVDMWQYTSKGSVPGVNGNVDLNIGFFTKDSV